MRTRATTGPSAATKALKSRNNDDQSEWISYFDEAELAAKAAHCFRDVNRGAALRPRPCNADAARCCPPGRPERY
jgi:hypothetical protein